MIFLQETLVASVEDCILWNKESNFKAYWSLSGVGVLMRDSSRFKNCSFRCDKKGRITMLNCSYCNQDLHFISIYAHTDGSQRIAYFETWIDIWLLVLLDAGDFASSCYLFALQKR